MDMPHNGIVYDMSNAEYHKQVGYSSSAIKTVCKQSLAHYMAQKPLGDSPAFAVAAPAFYLVSTLRLPLSSFCFITLRTE